MPRENLVRGLMMISCRKAGELMSEAQDRSLTIGERAELQIHLLVCALCQRVERQLAFLRGTFALWRRNPHGFEELITDPLPSAARARIHDEIARKLGPERKS